MNEPVSETKTGSVAFRCRGHINIRGTHAKTLELTSDADISESGTCIIGVSCEVDEEALLQLRGAVRIRLVCGAAEDTLTARINPLFRRGDPIIFRRNPDPGPRTFAVGASKGSAMLDRDLIKALKDPDAELVVEVEQVLEQDMSEGALFIVGTPIGNPADISARALDTLQSVDLIAAEDTRTLKDLLDLHGIKCKATSFHDHNERSRTPQLLERIARGDRIALVSDAGMPLLSDPGYNLVRAAREQDVLITVVPGPDAVTSALAISGLAPNDFRFIGFLPRKSGARQRIFADLKAEPYTLVFFEAPHRILDTLQDLHEVLGERETVVCKNLTKFGEDVSRGSPAELIETISARGTPRGELAVVVSGAAPDPESGTADVSPEIISMITALLRDNVPTKTIAAALAGTGAMNRRDAYDLVVKLK